MRDTRVIPKDPIVSIFMWPSSWFAFICYLSLDVSGPAFSRKFVRGKARVLCCTEGKDPAEGKKWRGGGNRWGALPEKTKGGSCKNAVQGLTLIERTPFLCAGWRKCLQGRLL